MRRDGGKGASLFLEGEDRRLFSFLPGCPKRKTLQDYRVEGKPSVRSKKKLWHLPGGESRLGKVERGSQKGRAVLLALSDENARNKRKEKKT